MGDGILDCVGRGNHVVGGDWCHQIVYRNRVNWTRVSVRGLASLGISVVWDESQSLIAHNVVGLWEHIFQEQWLRGCCTRGSLRIWEIW